jgi:hypothetical protein
MESVDDFESLLFFMSFNENVCFRFFLLVESHFLRPHETGMRMNIAQE